MTDEEKNIGWQIREAGLIFYKLRVYPILRENGDMYIETADGKYRAVRTEEIGKYELTKT